MNNFTPWSAMAGGALIGFGVSQMVNPEKVLAFLNLTGDWDPSLALVLPAALAIRAIGYRLEVRRGTLLPGNALRPPMRSDLDRKLIGGTPTLMLAGDRRVIVRVLRSWQDQTQLRTRFSQ
jgi:uncharacterized membrane protein YedE/YeeE